MRPFESYLIRHREKHLRELLEFLRFPSISPLSDHKPDVIRCAEHIARQLNRIGMEHVRLIPTPGHPVVYGDWLHAQGKPTVLIYGHYDVQPAEPEQWESPPFEPVIRDGKVVARGASDNKGQIFMHLKAVESLLATDGALPVNVKFCIEGEEEIGSIHLPGVLRNHREIFQVDVVVLSDTAMLGEDMPGVCYGLRGLAGLQMEVAGPKEGLHSGSFYGGTVQNPLHALVELIGSMRNPDGTIAIPGFYDRVRFISNQEKEMLAALPFDERKLASSIGVKELFGEPGYTALERVWTRPTLEVNALYGGDRGEGIQTVIPSKAHAKITCRLVPDQDPEEILDRIEQHVEVHCPKGVNVTIRREPGAFPYVAPIGHPAVQAAVRACEKGFGKRAFLIRAGGSVPIVPLLARMLDAPVVMVGFGLPDANVHGPNEHLPVKQWDRGVRTLGHYWHILEETDI